MAELPVATTLTFTLHVARGYIADPYYPEREEVINIQKSSGMNRAKSEAKREQNLREYLLRLGMTPEEYAALVVRANRPWYKNADEIIIPAHQLYGCFIQSAVMLSASQRPCDPNNFRHLIEVSDFATGKTKEDGVFERLVMPKSGTGQPLSNQRALRRNPYISNFDAHGTLTFYKSDFEEFKAIADFVGYAGQRIGVGASRKMGYGRFTVAAWSEL